MKTQNVLGLDLGTNSIGWAVVNKDAETSQFTGISNQGVRIIPMDESIMGDFASGNSVSQTKDRTASRITRRMYERRALRRERINRVMGILGFLPEHYSAELNRYGQLNKGAEPKLAWPKTDGKPTFLFQKSYNEMLQEFAQAQPELVAGGRKIAYDWTIYYLRKKALTQAISGPELAWLLMQFNQKRGYNQARGENEETNPTEKKEFFSLKVLKVTEGEKSKDGKIWYEVLLENDMVYKRQSRTPLDWEGKTKNFIVTTKLNEDGTEKTDKNGVVKRSLSVPKDDDWELMKVKTEHDLAASGKTVGEFIYDSLLHNPDAKIIGSLVGVVDRKFYKDELRRIVATQCQFIPELQSADLYKACIEALYPQNEAYRKSIAKKDFVYLLVDDLLFYQRPLKSKKSLINECPFESRTYKDKNGEVHRKYLKCIPKSHPLYEEFRAWQMVDNLHIYKLAADGVTKVDCTDEYITNREDLLTWLLTNEKVDQKAMLKHLAPKIKEELSWNYLADKVLEPAPVSGKLRKILLGKKQTDEEAEAAFAGFRQLLEKEHTNNVKKVAWLNDEQYVLTYLWHIFYSVTDRAQLVQAVQKYSALLGLNEDQQKKLSKMAPYEPQYGAYSLKAVFKLLAIMRSGEKWKWDAIDENTQNRIDNLITGEYNKDISDRVRQKLSSMSAESDFQGLPLWLAEYVVYDVKGDNTKWETPDDIDTYLQSFRLHSLNNPIVEQVVMESLRTVRDIWKSVGHIDEIHLEMGRDLKQNAEQRKRTLQRQQENESANLRAKMLLKAFMNSELDVEGAISTSPGQREIFRIYEDSVLRQYEMPEDIKKIADALSSLKEPTLQEIKKYRLWLDQKYLSPYTGQPIPLGKLFTPAYQIEHIIPQSLFFDDSMGNKVVCEAEVNALKTNMLGHEFISKCAGQMVTLSGGRVVSILSVEAYEKLVKDNFSKDANRQEHLMADELPEKFIARQLNDSRYISKLMKGLLSNIVRVQDPSTGEYEREETSKNLIVCNGSVTDRLKKDWGINDVWNRIILPRFERLNAMLGTNVYTAVTNSGHTIPAMPVEQSANFQKKRIDHRHHAMDAIVIACTTRNHVALLSNENATDGTNLRYDLQRLLRTAEAWTDKAGKKHTRFTDFIKPWDTFTQDTEGALRNIIVSFKQNLRIVTKTSNLYSRYVDGEKKLVKQEGRNLAIRKSMHKESVFGLVNLRFTKTESLEKALLHLDDVVNRELRSKLRELLAQGMNAKQMKKYFEDEKDVWADVDIKRIEVRYFTNETNDRYYAKRTALDDTFTAESIEKITDTGIQKILLAHLETEGGDPKEAFSPDGIERMNANIQALNGGVPHKPIFKVRKYELANKFAIGQVGVKAKKFVEAAKGTNLFFAVYMDKDKNGQPKRSFVSIPLKAVVDCQKQGFEGWKSRIDSWIKKELLVDAEAQLQFILSPGDLVYVPTTEEIESGEMQLSRDRIYKMVSSSGNRCFFILSNVASPILNKFEFSGANKMERSVSGEMIKEICIPISVGRLGNIQQQNG